MLWEARLGAEKSFSYFVSAAWIRIRSEVDCRVDTQKTAYFEAEYVEVGKEEHNCKCEESV